MSDREKQISDWVDGEQNQPMDQSLADFLAKKDANEEEQLWQKRVHTTNYISHQADITPEMDVPDWDRGAAFEKSNQPWWQWQGLPAVSMAFSIFAIALVLFKVELVVQDEGVLLSFGGQSSAKTDTEIAKVVDQKLREFASEQQVVLANYAADIKVKQQDNNLQLASYIMSTSRQERKEDMSDFVSYFNAQRKDEQLTQKIKYQQLEHKINFQNKKIDSNKLKLKPADWKVEE